MRVFIGFVWVSVIDICCFIANNASYELGAGAPFNQRMNVSVDCDKHSWEYKDLCSVKCHTVIEEDVMMGCR